MAVRDIFKITRKTFFNPSGWLDLDSLREQNQTIWTVFKSMFTAQRPEREETFSEAMKRLDLSERDVQFGATNYRIYALVFFLLGLLLMFYAFFLLFHYKTLLGWFLGMASAALFYAQAFKYDFWSLQMRRRKLGLTFKDWKKSILSDEEPRK